MDFRKIITIEPGKMGGKPCIRGMRITVYDVLDYLASGMTQDEILSDLPDLTGDDLRAWHTARPRPVIHNHLLTQTLAELLRDDARNDIDRAARLELGLGGPGQFQPIQAVHSTGEAAAVEGVWPVAGVLVRLAELCLGGRRYLNSVHCRPSVRS